jgi:signal transduction histidine kinase
MPSGATRIRWYRRLETQVLVCGAIVAGAALAALLTGTERVITRNARERVSEDLRSAKTTFDRLLADREGFASSQLQLIAELPVLRAHMTEPSARSDRATISAMAEHYRGSLGADFCVISDAEGRVMGSAGGDEPLVRSFLALYETPPHQSQRGVIDLDAALYIVVSEPARFADEVLGVLTAGYAVDDQVAEELAQRTRTEVSFMADGRVVGSSLSPSERALADETRAVDSGSDQLFRPSPLTSNMRGEYVAQAYPLGALDGPKPNSIVLMADWRPTERVLEQTRTRLLWVAVATFGVAIGGMLVLSRRVSRPLEIVAETAGHIASGRARQQLSIKGSAEATIMASAFNDMTGKLLERASALERARDAAQDAARVKAGFLANMSHEIRTPMVGVLGMSELLADTQLTEEQREFNDAIRTSADALLTVINDVLDYSKIEAGKIELEAVEFSPREVAEGVEALLAVQAHKKGVGFISGVDDDVPISVVGDAGRLRQILTNLVGNAVKFTAEGEIEMRVSVVEEQGNVATLSFLVRDTGVGIAPAALDRVFDGFTQADGSMTRKYGGSGLGLTIAKSLTEMMGGEMTVESEVDQGTTFSFSVPLVRADRRTDIRAPRPPSRPFQEPAKSRGKTANEHP